MKHVTSLVIGVTLLITGCASIQYPEGAIPSLALHPQSKDTDQCGPSTLRSVLLYYGQDISLEEIRGETFSPAAKGTLLTDLSRFARKHGFATELSQGTPQDLQQAIFNITPPIILLKFKAGPLSSAHITAVTGIEKEGVFVIGSEPDDDFYPKNLFEDAWYKAGNMMLLITPVESP